MHDVTGELVQLLEPDVSKQRLDSTHIESNIAKFGRMKLIVSAIPETAVKSDSAALEIVIDDLKERGLLPDRLLAGTAYGSDDNDILCRSENISLVSPTSGKCPADHVDPDAITVSDFRIEDGEAMDEHGRTIIVPTCVECPAG